MRIYNKNKQATFNKTGSTHSIGNHLSSKKKSNPKVFRIKNRRTKTNLINPGIKNKKLVTKGRTMKHFRKSFLCKKFQMKKIEKSNKKLSKRKSLSCNSLLRDTLIINCPVFETKKIEGGRRAWGRKVKRSDHQSKKGNSVGLRRSKKLARSKVNYKKKKEGERSLTTILKARASSKCEDLVRNMKKLIEIKKQEQ